MFDTGSLMFYHLLADLSFGAIEDYKSTKDRNIWDWGSDPTQCRGHLLIDRILAVPKFQEIYGTYLSALFATYVTNDIHGPLLSRISTMHEQVQPAARVDYWRRLDNLFSYANFEMNLQFTLYRNMTLPFGYYEPYYVWQMAIFEWLNVRIDSALQQLADPPFANGNHGNQ